MQMQDSSKENGGFLWEKVFGDLLDLLLPQSEVEKRLAHLTEAELASHLFPVKPAVVEGEALTLFRYGDPLIKRLVWALKYKKNEVLRDLAARVMWEFLLEEFSERKTFGTLEEPLLVPVPLSKEREKERGYNQASWIAEKIAKESAGFLTLHNSILKKIRDTRPQTSLPREERKINLKDAFRITDPSVLIGRDIILFDDVITTGSTVSEIAELLLSAKARRVLSVALAH